MAVIMFGVALDLRLADFLRLTKVPKPAIVGVVSQFLVLPLLTFLLVLVIEPRPSIAMGMMIVAACPGGNVSNFMTSLARGNVALSVSLTAISTVAAIFMTPFNLSFWASLYPPTAAILTAVSIDTFEVFQTIVLILAIPLTLGMLVRHYYPKTAVILMKWLKPISIIIFIAFVLVAFSNNISIFLEYFQFMVLIVFVHNALAFTCGYSMATIFGLSDDDRKSITIETGIQNSGLGLLLIFSFFHGLGGMAMIAAWWGIWHIISGLTLGMLWSKYTLQSA
ncbi:MAG TPA: bile acid:sodium symporter family protein [Fulvivirga sp.]|nr:bile acid:sodium symporter family protein [Fulvivirga sp.]